MVRLFRFLCPVVFFFSLVFTFGLLPQAEATWSVDQCLALRKWNYNEEYGIWVGDSVRGVTRCEVRNKEDFRSMDDVWKAYAGFKDASSYYDPAGAVNFSVAPPERYFRSGGDILVPVTMKANWLGETIKADDPVNAVLACADHFEGNIISHSSPNDNMEENWEDECDYMPSVGLVGQYGAIGNDRFSFGGDTSDATELIYSGGGLAVPSEEYEIKGISKVRDLKSLLIGWTNFLLPYVSIISVFALVAAGMFYLLSFASEDLHTKAKSILMYVVIGILLILSAFTIVNTLLSVTVS